MAVSFDRLWKQLVDRDMSASELRKVAMFAPNTLTRMRKNQPVSLAVLDRICDVLSCDYADIIEHVQGAANYHDS